MKLKYKILHPIYMLLALSMAALFSLLLCVLLNLQLKQECAVLVSKMESVCLTIDSACIDSILQNANVNMSEIQDIVFEQYRNVEIKEDETQSELVITYEDPVLIATRSIEANGSIWSVCIYSDISELLENWETMLHAYHIVYLALLICSYCIVYFVTKRVLAPLNELSKASQALALGDFNRRANITSTDEVGQLANIFNSMADSLSDQIKRQERFIEGFTHELKTPLSAIFARADNIRAGYLSNEEMQNEAHRLIVDGKRLNSLSDTMTNWIICKKELSNFSELHVSLLFEDVLSLFPVQVSSGYITISSKSQNAIILGDRSLLVSLLANIVKNGLNADAEHIELTCSIVADEMVSITVSDNGCGMDKSVLDKITEPFFRVDKARSRRNGGIGLGLSLCKDIVELHNGKLAFSSQPQTGTSVVITLSGKEIPHEC